MKLYHDAFFFTLYRYLLICICASFFPHFTRIFLPLRNAAASFKDELVAPWSRSASKHSQCPLQLKAFSKSINTRFTNALSSSSNSKMSFQVRTKKWSAPHPFMPPVYCEVAKDVSDFNFASPYDSNLLRRSSGVRERFLHLESST